VPDIVDAATRSRMMAGIKGKNTGPEMLVRSGLHRTGLRFRLNASLLPGRPDVVLKKHKTAVFVHGCFWHAHLCPAFHLPASNQLFWLEKLEGNARRDRAQVAQLKKLGWRVLVIWECALGPDVAEKLFQIAHEWVVNYDLPYLELSRSQRNGISKRRFTSRAL
jgi:DNA mismatch endonuclease (patch repair protein)